MRLGLLSTYYFSLIHTKEATISSYSLNTNLTHLRTYQLFSFLFLRNEKASLLGRTIRDLCPCLLWDRCNNSRSHQCWVYKPPGCCNRIWLGSHYYDLHFWFKLGSAYKPCGQFILLYGRNRYKKQSNSDFLYFCATFRWYPSLCEPVFHFPK